MWILVLVLFCLFCEFVCLTCVYIRIGVLLNLVYGLVLIVVSLWLNLSCWYGYLFVYNCLFVGWRLVILVDLIVVMMFALDSVGIVVWIRFVCVEIALCFDWLIVLFVCYRFFWCCFTMVNCIFWFWCLAFSIGFCLLMMFVFYSINYTLFWCWNCCLRFLLRIICGFCFAVRWLFW